jgi:Spy/CpxP family protein refolding chaperone
MRKSLVISSLGAALIALLVPAWAAAPAQTNPAPAANTTPNPEQAIAKYRDDMQAKRADIMAKGLTLSADQAAKFWPMFEQYQKEQNVVIDAQIKAIQKYAASYEKLTDADALEFVNVLLDRDGKMQALRVKWLTKFQSVVSGGTAARAIQIDRRLSLLAQAELSSQIPLVH